MLLKFKQEDLLAVNFEVFASCGENRITDRLFLLWFGVVEIEMVQGYQCHLKDEHPKKIKQFRLCDDYQLKDKI